MARASSKPLARARSLDVRSPTLQLGLAGLGIAVLFAVFLVAPEPLWSAQPSRPPTQGSTFEPVGWAGGALALVFGLAMCLPFRPYLLAQRALERTLISTRWLIGICVVVAGVALLIYPAYGSDVFDYAGFERMWAVYGDNPLLALPVNHPSDWATAFVWYPDRTPAYGPLWALLTWPIVRLAGDSPIAVVIGYKILSITVYTLCGWLIWATVEPQRRQRALVAFAWSPLVLFEVLGKVHNDVLPALAILAAVWLVRSQRLAAFSLAAAAAGGLVKITALAAAPPIAVVVWRRNGWRAVLLGGVLAGLVVAALYAPFWVGPQSLAPIWNQTSRVVWSPASVLMLASAWLPGGPYGTAVRAALAACWLIACAALLLRKRPCTPWELAAASAWVLLFSIYLLTSAVFAHYLVPAVALAAVANDERLQLLVMWLSLGGLAAYAVELLGLAIGPSWAGSDAYQLVGTFALLGPAAAMLAVRYVKQDRV